MSDDQVRTNREQLDRIERAIAGEPALGHKGLAQRMNDAETVIAGHDRKLVLWGGVVTGLSVAASYLKTKLIG